LFMVYADADEPSPPRRSTALLVVVISAIIAMPFVAGRHPSGAQTLLILAACAALVAISLGLLRGRRDTPSDQPRADEVATPEQWPAPDDLWAYRQRARR
jgi:hypothetical protein